MQYISAKSGFMDAGSRQPRREEGEREGGAKEEEKNRKTVEGENLASLSRAYAYTRAFQPQCCFFAVTSVTLAMEKG